MGRKLANVCRYASFSNRLIMEELETYEIVLVEDAEVKIVLTGEPTYDWIVIEE